jgi:hypothetical protein
MGNLLCITMLGGGPEQASQCQTTPIQIAGAEHAL